MVWIFGRLSRFGSEVNMSLHCRKMSDFDEKRGKGIKKVFLSECFKIAIKSGPGQTPGLFSQYPVGREGFRPKVK